MKQKIILGGLILNLIVCTIGMFCVGYADGSLSTETSVCGTEIMQDIGEEDLAIITPPDVELGVDTGILLGTPAYIFPEDEVSFVIVPYNSGQIPTYTQGIFSILTDKIKGNMQVSFGAAHIDVECDTYDYLVDDRGSYQCRVMSYTRYPTDMQECSPPSTYHVVFDPIHGMAYDVSEDNKVKDVDGNIITSLDADAVFDYGQNAVQNHTAETAIYSAWGVRVDLDEEGYIRGFKSYEPNN